MALIQVLCGGRGGSLLILSVRLVRRLPGPRPIRKLHRYRGESQIAARSIQTVALREQPDVTSSAFEHSPCWNKPNCPKRWLRGRDSNSACCVRGLCSQRLSHWHPPAQSE